MAKDRPLRNVYQRLGNFDAEIRAAIAERGSADILEIGCGLGLPMIELIRKFRGRVRPVGINRDAEFNDPGRAMWAGVRRRALMPWVPLTHSWRYPLPEYVNCDAALRLPFADDSFDFCYSIATSFFLTDRMHLLTELNRVLRPGRTARLHFSHSLEEFPKYRSGAWSADDLAMIVIRDGDGADVDFRAFVDGIANLEIRQSGRYEYVELTATDGDLALPVELQHHRPMRDISDAFPADFQRSEYLLTA